MSIGNNICPLPFYGATFAYVAGAGYAPTANFLQPFENTKEIIILNTSTADTVLVQIDLFSPAPAALTRATMIPPGTSITLAVGPVGYRTTLGESNAAGYLDWYLYIQPSGGNVTVDFNVNITYVQSQGGGGMVSP